MKKATPHFLRIAQMARKQTLIRKALIDPAQWAIETMKYLQKHRTFKQQYNERKVFYFLKTGYF